MSRPISDWALNLLLLRSRTCSKITSNNKKFVQFGLNCMLAHPFRQDREKKVSKFEQSGLTEEELLAKQEELFAASRAKFQSTQQ